MVSACVSPSGLSSDAGGLAEDPSSALAHYTRALDAAWRHLAGGLTAHPDTVLGADGRLHAAKVTAVPDPPSLTDLRTHCQAMLPRVDLPELILEVMSWCPGFVDAFTAASGGQPRMADLHVTIAGALAAQSLNVGFTPIVSEVTPALSRDRFSHVDQNYLRPENYSAANAVLISAQAVLSAGSCSNAPPGPCRVGRVRGQIPSDLDERDPRKPDVIQWGQARAGRSGDLHRAVHHRDWAFGMDEHLEPS